MNHAGDIMAGGRGGKERDRGGEGGGGRGYYIRRRIMQDTKENHGDFHPGGLEFHFVTA